MDWKQKKEYVQRATIRRSELLEQLYSEPAPSRIEKDIITLEIMELDIMPDSKAWRWGYKGVLRRARNALIEKMKEEQP